MLHGLALSFVAVAVLDASPPEIALLNAAGLLPNVALGLFAAGWVDRLPRRRVLVLSDWIRALVVLWVPAAAYLELLSLGQLYAMAIALGFASFVFEVAHQSFLPDLVAKPQLLEANGQLRAVGAVSEGVAFAAGGWLVQIFSPPLVLLFDSASYVLSALFLQRIDAPETHLGANANAEPTRSGSLVTEIREGIGFIARHPLLFPSTGAVALIHFGFRTVGPVYLLYVYRELGFQPGVLGMVFAVGAISSLAGALAVAPISRRLGMGRGMILGLGLFAGSILVLPLAPGAGLVGLLVLCVAQAGDGFEVLFDVNQASLRQTVTPASLLGRVSGSVEFASSFAGLLGVAAGGLLGGTIGLRPTLVVAGSAVLIGAVWLALSRVRALR
jgi:MFS family permease